MTDDDAVLTDYVLGHYMDLLNGWERRVLDAEFFRWLLRESPNRSPKFVARAELGVPEVDAALADGVDAFRRRVRVRLLAEHGDAIVVNRCPGCSGIVRTPLARQCFGCGRDWHHDAPV